MTKIAVYSLEGNVSEELKLDDSVFGLSKNDDLVHQVYLALSANRRQSIAHTKNRGERAGSGVKPWRQKGTGRARVGSVRTPLWKKGGVAFGPRSERNYSQKINKKMNAKAIATVLSGKLKDGQLMVVETLQIPEKKTKGMANLIDNLKLTGRVLMSFSKEEQEYRKSSRNIKKIENILTSQLNVLGMLNNKNLLMSKNSVKYIEDKYKEK